MGRVALGTWSMGGWMWSGDADESASHDTIERALDMGVDMIDTAPAYGFGLSERLVGEALAERSDSEKVVVATKCGLIWDDRHEPWRDASADSIRREVFESLERLGRESIDLYQLHWPDPATPVEATAQTMCSMLEEGLVRSVGVCNFSAKQLTEFAGVCPVAVCQSPYNLFQRDIELEVLPAIHSVGARLLAYSPLARGMLTGAMRPDAEPTDEARRRAMFHGEPYRRHLAVVDHLDGWAQEHYERGVLQLALRWILDGVDSSVVLWGARRPGQLDGLDDVWGWQLTEDDRAQIDEIVTDGLAGA